MGGGLALPLFLRNQTRRHLKSERRGKQCRGPGVISLNPPLMWMTESIKKQAAGKKRHWCLDVFRQKYPLTAFVRIKQRQRLNTVRTIRGIEQHRIKEPARSAEVSTYHPLWFSSSLGHSQGLGPHQCVPSPTPDIQSISPGLPAPSWWHLHRCPLSHGVLCPPQLVPGSWPCSARWRRGG